MEEKLDKLIEIVNKIQIKMEIFQKTQDKFQETQDEMKQDITKLKFDVKTLKSDTIVPDTHILEIENDLKSLKNTVCFIEENHGRKLQALLDRGSDYIKKDTEYNFEFTKINKTLDRHDARIYNLEHLA